MAEAHSGGEAYDGRMVGRGIVLGVLLASACSSERPPISNYDRMSDRPSPAASFIFAKDRDVGVVLTADNSYAFGWGDRDVLRNFRSRPITRVAADIFNCPTKLPDAECSEEYCGPEAYVVPAAEAPESAFLYVVAWSDFWTTQGLIGQFRRGDGPPLYTGDAAWEVCATGEAHADDDGPSQDGVNAKIALCNAGDPGVPSRGWVNAAGPVTPGALGTVAVGEPNDGQQWGSFPTVCGPTTATPGVEKAARWMWYAPPSLTPDQAFTYNDENATQTYLVFRIPATSVPVILK